MTPERYRQIRELLEAAFDVEHEKRAEFLAQACGADTELRKEVESLLAHETHVPDNFLADRRGK